MLILPKGGLSKKDKDELVNLYKSEEESDHVHAILRRANLSSDDGVAYVEIDNNFKITNSHLENGNCVTVVQKFIFNNKIENRVVRDMPFTYTAKSFIIVYYSRKYNKDALIALVSEIFRNVIDLSNEKYALLLCKKE